jgi:hypothetical protein
MNPYKFQVVEYCAEWPYGINNRIVASAATLKGCMSEYKRHLKIVESFKIDHKPLKTVFLCDGVPFDVQPIEESTNAQP